MRRHIIIDFLGCLLRRRLNFEVKDRIVLGLIAGVIGNVGKNTTISLLKRIGLNDALPYEKGAGVFLNRLRAKTPSGMRLGLFVDFCIACKLGVMLVYLLSFTGRDHHLLKGVTLGQSAWLTMYGALASLGATRINSTSPKGSFANALGHSVFGLVAAKTIVTIGDPNLFKPRYSSIGNPSEDY